MSVRGSRSLSHLDASGTPLASAGRKDVRPDQKSESWNREKKELLDAEYKPTRRGQLDADAAAISVLGEGGPTPCRKRTLMPAMFLQTSRVQGPEERRINQSKLEKTA